MNILILGAGEIGASIAEKLSLEGHNITIMDRDQDAIEKISSKLDIMALNAACINADELKLAGIESADLVVSATEVDEVNLIASLLAKEFGVPYTIARVQHISDSADGYVFPYHKLGVDKVINPDFAVMVDILKLSRTGRNTSNIMNFAKGDIKLVRIDIRSNNNNLMNKKIIDISSMFVKKMFLIVLVVRNGVNHIPDGEFVLQEDDQVYIVIKNKEYAHMLEAFGIEQIKNNRVIIVGGGELGFSVAKKLEKEFSSVKIIEENRDRCRFLAEHLSSTLVLKGDGTDVKLLLQENIKETDLFIATSADDKQNLLAGLLAKNNGVKKTISVIKRSDYVAFVPELGIDHVISPRISVINEILQYVRSGKVMSVMTLADTEAEILEQEITKECTLTRNPLSELKLQNMIIGAAIKNGNEAIIPDGNFQAEIGDRIVVFSGSNDAQELRQLFE